MRAVRMGRAGRRRVPDGIEPVDVKEPSRRPVDDALTTGAASALQVSSVRSGAPQGLLSGLPGPLGAAIGVAVALCLAASLVHVLLVFLHVAPANKISQQYDKQIDVWVRPLFEQNWRLFAPEPQSVNRQISARTRLTSADGTVQVGDWFDLSAVDDSSIKRNPFPSHTSQNMLRRAWIAYAGSHGSDDKSHSERARMVQKYLRNIAVDRVAAHRRGAFDAIQLRVITRPIAAAAQAGRAHPNVSAPSDTRYLPWWKAAPHDN